MEQSTAILQAGRRAAKVERQRSRDAHPFARQLAQTPGKALYDDGRLQAPAVLVAIPGGADKMGGIPTVDFFDQIEDLAVRRVLLRGLTVPGSGPHELGTSVEEIAERLHALIEGHPRVVFTGASIGGFLALLFGTMLSADALILFGPTTCLDPEFLRSVGDHRYDGSPFLEDPEWVTRFADPTRLWETQRPPKIVLHFGYRNESTRPHAERLAPFPNVTLKPHYERTLMAKIRDDGTLRRDLRHALLG